MKTQPRTPLLLLLLFIASSLLPALVYGQATVFQRLFKGPGHFEMLGLVACADGSYLLHGRSNGTGSADNGIIIKVDQVGEFLWAKEFVGPQNEYIYDAIELPNGDFALCGLTASFGTGAENAFAMRLDSSGTLLWSKYLGSSSYDQFTNIAPDGTGGFYCSGNTPFPSVSRFDAAGNRMWTKQWSGTLLEKMPMVYSSSAMGPIILVPTNNNLIQVYQLRLNGTVEWSKAYVDGTGVPDAKYHVVQHPTGQIWITYSFSGTGSNQNSFDAAVCRLDSAGGLISAYLYGSSSNDMVTTSEAGADSSIVITGWTDRPGNGDTDPFIMKIRFDGTVNWCRSHGAEWNERSREVHATVDGGWVFGGMGYQGVDSFHAYMGKVDDQGNENCTTLPWTPVKHIQNLFAQAAPASPTSTSPPIHGDIVWNVVSRTFSPDRFCDGLVAIEEDEQPVWMVSPNPASSAVAVTGPWQTTSNLRFALFDTQGRLVREEGLTASSFEIGLSGIPSGLYCYTLSQSNGKRHSGKLILR